VSDVLPVRPAPPALVSEAHRLRDAFQSGNDQAMLDMLRGGMLARLMDALCDGNDRTLTYAAPQIASLAERVGWVQQQPG
jgi:hypothetical protein